jgi:hypothetical protein
MTKLHLKYVQSFGGYHYFRRRGMRIPLPGLVGSPEFMAAYPSSARRRAHSDRRQPAQQAGLGLCRHRRVLRYAGFPQIGWRHAGTAPRYLGKIP